MSINIYKIYTQEHYNVYYTPSPIDFGNPPSVVTVQDEGSRHNLSGILSQLLDLTTTQIISVATTISSTTNQATITRHIIIIITRLLTTMLTLILASQYVVQNRTTQVKTTSLTISRGWSIVVIMTES